MKNVSYLCAKKYIFPTIVRKYYRICGLLTLIGLLCFALFMLGIGMKQDTDKTPCFALAAIFGMLHIWYLIVWVKHYHLINATYDIDGYIACNCVDKLGINISIDLSLATRSNYKHSFRIGNASFSVVYIIFSECMFSDNIESKLEGKNIYKIMKEIWASRAVIVPYTN